MASSYLLWFLPLNLAPTVGVNAAYTIHSTPSVVVPADCCGRCRNGVITHGDGHTTPCPCPADCKCKRKAEPVCDSCPKPAK